MIGIIIRVSQSVSPRLVCVYTFVEPLLLNGVIWRPLAVILRQCTLKETQFLRTDSFQRNSGAWVSVWGRAFRWHEEQVSAVMILQRTTKPTPLCVNIFIVYSLTLISCKSQTCNKRKKYLLFHQRLTEPCF